MESYKFWFQHMQLSKWCHLLIKEKIGCLDDFSEYYVPSSVKYVFSVFAIQKSRKVVVVWNSMIKKRILHFPPSNFPTFVPQITICSCKRKYGFWTYHENSPFIENAAKNLEDEFSLYEGCLGVEAGNFMQKLVTKV